MSSYIGLTPLNGQFRKLDALTFNGSTTAFDIRVAGVLVSPGSTMNMIVSVNNQIKEPITDYLVVGNQIQFSVAPTGGSSFWGVMLGGVGTINDVADGSITSAKIVGGTFKTING